MTHPMFNKLKSFSEDVAKSFNEIQHSEPANKSTEQIARLKGSSGVLKSKTPSVLELIQPSDEAVNEEYNEREENAGTSNTEEAAEIVANGASVANEVSNEKPNEKSKISNESNESDEKSNEKSNDKQNGSAEQRTSKLGANSSSKPPFQDIDLDEVTPQVRAKLKKFLKYEEKYPVLLDAYKTEKRKNELIVTFEHVLSEYTPVSSISDVELLIEFLKGLTEKAKLSNEELRKCVGENSRLAKENADLAKNYSDAQKTLKYAEQRLGESAAQVADLQEQMKSEMAHSGTPDSGDASELKKVQSMYEAEKQTNSELLARIESLKVDSKGAEQEDDAEDSLSGENQGLLSEVDSLKSKLATESQRADEAVEKVNKLEFDLSSLKSKCSSVEEELATTKEAAKNAETPMSIQEPSIIGANNAAKFGEQRLQTTSSDSKTREEEPRTLTASSESLRIESNISVSKCAAEIRELKTQVTDIKKELMNYEDSEKSEYLKQKSKDLEMKSECLENISSNLEEKLQDLEKQYAKAKSLGHSEILPESAEISQDHNSKSQDSIVLAGSCTTELSPSIPEKNIEDEKMSNSVKTVENKKIDGDNHERSLENVKDVSKETSALSLELELKQAEVERLELSLQQESEQIERLEKSQCNLVEELRDAKKALENKNSDLDSVRESLKEVGNEFLAAKDELKEMELKCKRLKESEDERESNESAVATEKIETLENLVSSLEKQLQTTKQENASETEASQRKSRVELREVRKKLSSAEQKLESTNNELAEIKNQANASQEEATTASEKIKLLEEEIQVSKRESISLEERLKKCKQTLDTSEKANEVLKNEKEKLDVRLNELNQHKSIDSALKLEIASLQSSITHKDEQLKELKEDLNKKNTERDSLNDQISTLTANLDDLRKSNESLKEESKVSIQRNEASTEKANLLTKEISNLQIEKQKVVTELENLKLKHENLSRTKASASDEVQEIKHQYGELAMEAKETQAKIDTLEEELAEARNLLQERTRESFTLRRMIMDNEEEYKNKYGELRNEMRVLGDEKSELEAEHQVVLKKRQRKIDELKDTCERASKRIADLKTSYDELRAKAETSTHQFTTDDTQKAQELEITIDDMRAALSTCTKKTAELEKSNTILKRLNDESNLKFERLSKNYKHVTQQYRVMKEKYQQQSPAATQKTVDEEHEPQPKANTAYMKNVLVGFLEHKDQRSQLLPVLKALFDFDDNEEKKLVEALR